MNLKLRHHREAEGLTQKQFARKIGKSIGTIQSWERGDSYPNAEAIWVMCVYFHTTPNDFLGWYESHPREAMAEDLYERELITSYRASTEQRKANILQTARDAAGMSKEASERGVSEPSEREAM